MTKKSLPLIEVTFDRIIGGGQAIGTLENGKKCMAWGGLPGEKALVQVTKKKSSYLEGYVTEVLTPSPQRIEPRDPGSYLSTSPWQIMDFDSENHYKSALIEEAFELHDIVLPAPITAWSDGVEFGYRNKVEFSFWYDTDKQQLDLAFFRRGSHGKVIVEGTSLAADSINQTGRRVLAALRKLAIDGRSLKTLLIRSNRGGDVAWQLYVKHEDFDADALLKSVDLADTVCAEVIYSNPKSPASVITKRLAATSDKSLSDTILDVPFTYATEGFFQINLPVYERALRDMGEWVVDAPLATLSSPFAASPPKSPGMASRRVSIEPTSVETRAADIPEDLVDERLDTGSTPARVAVGGAAPAEDLAASGSPVVSPARVTRGGAAPPESIRLLAESEGGADRAAGPASSALRGEHALARAGNDASGVESGDGSSIKAMGDSGQKVIDLYSGVGTIGLTIGGNNVTLIESNEHAVREMERNIAKLGKTGAKAILAPSEKALDHITGDAIVIVDPPRAGLHEDVVWQLLDEAPERIIYLSCNPVTQARDVAKLAEKYGIRHHQGYNFFPRTPHIEHLVVLDKK